MRSIALRLKERELPGSIKRGFLLICLALIPLAACKINLIGGYDEVTDQSIQKIQAEVFTLIAKLERNIKDHSEAENDYRNFKSAYEMLAGELESLRVRCGAIPKYDVILGQVAALTENVSNMEKLHKTGINSQMLAPVKSAFELQFSSMIKVQNGLKKIRK